MKFQPSIAIAVAIGTYLLLGALIFTVQTQLTFPATHLYDDRDTAVVPLGVERVLLPDGIPLWMAGDHDRIVLLCHGNAEWIGNMEAAYRGPLDAFGFSFAAVEYRDVADAPGPLTEAHLKADVIAAIDVLVARGWPLDRIILHGRSIGGGVASLALEDRQPAGIVLESTFDSLSAVVAGKFPLFLYPRFLLSTPLRTDQRLEGRDLPVFQVHDLYDAVIPIARARALRSGLVDVTVTETAGYSHGTPIVLTDERANEEWRGWLNEVVPRSHLPE